MWILGAGGFGRETHGACVNAGLFVDGFLDDGLAGHEVYGHLVCRATDVPPAEFVVAIADPGVRLRLHRSLIAEGWSPVTVVDPRAVVGPGSAIGPGSILLATAFISCDVALGAAAQVNYGATIGHDTVAGDGLTVLPGANVGGAVRFGEGVLMGSGAVVLQGLDIGDRSVVGAGAVVTRSVTAGETVVGVPARPTGG